MKNNGFVGLIMERTLSQNIIRWNEIAVALYE
jgi:hypothetical protein